MMTLVEAACWPIVLTLFHVSWVGAVIGLIAFGLNRITDGASSSTRYGINVVALCACAISLPVTFLVVGHSTTAEAEFRSDRNGNHSAETDGPEFVSTEPTPTGNLVTSSVVDPSNVGETGEREVTFQPRRVFQNEVRHCGVRFCEVKPKVSRVSRSSGSGRLYFRCSVYVSTAVRCDSV